MSDGRYYVLDDMRRPRPVKDVMEWAHWFETADRRVAEDTFGDIRVSTVFLGFDHDHLGRGPPLLFETMIFGGVNDGWQDRCSTWEEAVEMHASGLAVARGGLN